MISLLMVAVAGRGFYVDAVRGNDAFDGSAARPWRSLARASKAKLAKGDRVLLTGGQTFKGSLKLSKASGVTIASFGKGVATIQAGVADGLVLDGGQDLTVDNLKLVGAGLKPNQGRGLYLKAAKRVKIDRIDVTGFRVAGVEAADSEDVTITRVNALKSGIFGIYVSGGKGLPRAKRFTIRDSRVIGNSGDGKNPGDPSLGGIVLSRVDEALVEYCEVAGNGVGIDNKQDGTAGIWAWNVDRVTIQHCISHGNLGLNGGGFHFDGGVTNSVLQYNLSYGNAGAGYLLRQILDSGAWKDNVVRYNVSYEDGRKNFQAGIGIFEGGGNFSNAQVYNNTVVNAKDGVNANHAMPGLTFTNNIFLVEGDAAKGEVEDALFVRNLVWRSKQRTLDHLEAHVKPGGQDLHDSRHINPRVILPRSAAQLPRDPRKLAAMRFFRLREGSPASAAGIAVPGAPAKDFFGKKLGATPSVGAAE